MAPWNDIIKLDRFKVLDAETQRATADNYFEAKIESDPKYNTLSTQDKIKTQMNFLSTIGQAPDTVGGFSAPLKTGIANMSAIISNPLRLVGNYLPEDEAEHFFNAANDIDVLASRFRPDVTATGAYAEKADMSKWWALNDPKSPLNPKRLVSTGAQYAPLSIALGLSAMANPALGTALMSMVEGGDIAKNIREYEETTGKQVPAWQQYGVTAIAAVINGQLEKLGAEAMVGQLFKGKIAGRIARTVLAMPTEGVTEGMQRGVTILAEAGFNPRTAAQAMQEITDSIYGGFAGAVVGSPLTFAMSGEEQVTPKPLTDEEKAKLAGAGITVGAPEGTTPPVTQDAGTPEKVSETKTATLTPALVAQMAAIKVQAARGKDTKEDIENLVNNYAAVNPQDVDGEGFRKIILDVDMKARKSKKAGQVVLNLPNDITMPLTIDSAHVKPDVISKVTEALAFAAMIKPETLSTIKEVHVVGRSNKAWVSALAKKLSGGKIDFTTMQIADKEFNTSDAVTFAEKWKNNDSVYFKTKDGDTVIFMREAAPKALSSEIYAFYTGHEFGHAEGITEETLADLAGMEMFKKFVEAKKKPDMLRFAADPQMVLLAKAKASTKSAVIKEVLEQREDEHVERATMGKTPEVVETPETFVMREDLPQTSYRAGNTTVGNSLLYFVKGLSYTAANRAYNGLRWLTAERVLPLNAEVTVTRASDEDFFEHASQIFFGLPYAQLKAQVESLRTKETLSDAMKWRIKNFERITHETQGAQLDNKIVIRERGTGKKTDAYIKLLAHEGYHYDVGQSDKYNELQKLVYDKLTGEEITEEEIGAITEAAHAGKLLEKDTARGSNIVFQKRAEHQSLEAKKLVRLINSTKLFKQIFQSAEQLYDSLGDPVNAVIDLSTGTLYLSPDIDISTVGHEATEMVIDALGLNHPVVAKGIKMFGDKEKLSDAVGEYFYTIETNAGIIEKVGAWLQELWAAFKVQFGIELAQTEVVAFLNTQLYSASTASKSGFAMQKRKGALWEDLHDKNILARLDAGLTERKQTESSGTPRPAPDRAGNINLNTIAWTDEEKAMARRLIESYAVNFDEYTDEEAFVDAAKVLADKERLEKVAQKLGADKAVTHGEFNAFLMAYTILGRQWVKAQIGVTEGTTTPQEFKLTDDQFKAWTVVHSMINNKYGTRLRAIGVFGSSPTSYANLEKLIKESTPAQRQAILDALDAGMPAKAIQDKFVPPRLWEYLFTMMYSGILSGPSIFTNTFSNAAWMTWLFSGNKVSTATADKVLSTPLAKKLMPTLNNYERTAYFKDIATSWKAAWTGVSKARRLAVQAWRTGEVPTEMRIADEHGMGFKDMGMAKNPFAHPLAPAWMEATLAKTPWGNISVASMFGAPFKTMMITDVFFRSMAIDAYVANYVDRITRQTGTAPTTVPKAIMAEAHAFGAHAVFMDPPGKLTRAAYSVREAVPFGMGRAVVPFINTLTNLLKRGVERFPVLGIAAARTDLKAGKYGKVFAAQIEGTVAAFLLLTLFDEDRLTGAPPEDKARRDAFFRQGRQAYSFKVGNQWVSYRRLDPFNIIISNVCALRDTILHDQTVDEITLTERFGNLAFALAQNITQSSFADNMMNLLTDEGKFNNWIARLPSTFVPYNSFWRTINASIEAEMDGGRQLNDQNTMLSLISDSLPYGVGAGLGMPEPEKEIDAMGEKVLIPGGALQQWLPVKWRRENTDAVEAELVELGIYPGLPSQTRKLRGRDVKIDDKMYWEYVQAYGAATKAAITRAIESPYYRRANDERRRAIIYKAINPARERIQRQLDQRLYREYREELVGLVYNGQ